MDKSPRRIVIIGGVAAGMSTATRLRRLDESADIIILERSGHVSFANCGLAYHVGGVIPDRADLLLQTPEGLARRFRLDVRVHSEVTSIDLAARTVTVNGNDVVSYDELVIATGATPVVPAIPGAERMLVLRSIEDTDRLSAEVDALPPGSRIVVAGAGYIGVELAENLTFRGFDVTLVQRGTHILGSLDPEMASPVEAHLARNGVDVRLGVTLARVERDHVSLDDGSALPSLFPRRAFGPTAESRLMREFSRASAAASESMSATERARRTSGPSAMSPKRSARLTRPTRLSCLRVRRIATAATSQTPLPAAPSLLAQHSAPQSSKCSG